MPHPTVDTAPLISASDVTKSFTAGARQVEILHGVSLHVAPGEVVALMGPSGSGKSTLMYCLAGLEKATGGSIHLLGQELGRLSRSQLARMRATEVGFVFQSYNMVPSLTAYDNVALPFRLAGRKIDRSRIEQTLDSLGILPLANQRPVTMSGGEQQRVALARVLAMQPRLVFADEPTGALDTRTGQTVLAELVRIGHQQGHGVLVVTHDPTVAAACDRVLFLRDGVLVDERRTPSADDVAALMTRLSEREGGAA